MSRTVNRSSRWTINTLGVIFRRLVDVQITGMENLPEDGGFILTPNHISNIDPVGMWYGLTTRGVPVRIMAKKEMLTLPVLGAWFRSIGLVPVDRHATHPGESLRAARAAIESGEGVLIYPEGTFTAEPDYWPMRAKTGAARLALDTGAPVIPVAQWGAQDILGRYSLRIRLAAHQPMRVHILPAVDLSDLRSDQGSQDHEAVEEATMRIFRAITAGVEDLRGGKAPEVPFDPRTSAGARPAKKHGRRKRSRTTGERPRP